MTKSVLCFLFFCMAWPTIAASQIQAVKVPVVPAIPAGAQIGVPIAPPKIAVPAGVSGYTVTVSDDWVCALQGYYPIRVTIATNPAKATTRDELFTLSVTNQQWRQSPAVVSTPIVIPAGAKSVSKEIYVQSLQSFRSSSSEILIERGQFDGRFSRGDLLGTVLNGRSRGGNNWERTLLFVSSDRSAPSSRSFVCYGNSFQDSSQTKSMGTSTRTPSFHTLVDLYLGGGNQGPTAGLLASSAIGNTDWLHAVHPDYLPENWIGLTSVEEILISLDDLVAVCSKNELQRSNLEKWVAAGGVLLVNDTKDFASGSKILPALLGAERSFVADKGLTNWKVANDEIKALEKLHVGGSENNHYYNASEAWMDRQTQAAWMNQYETSAKLEFKKLSEVPEASTLCVGSYLQGEIAIIPSDMGDWPAESWMELRNMLSIEGMSIHSKIGKELGSNEVEGYEIPGVGRPPVRLFQYLITGFLLLAGPVMLLILKRMDKMQLMFAIIPILSAMVCASLFFYVMLADGIHRWGRVQSYTTLDHRTNMAVTHARAAYYSGAAPRQYSYSDQVMVFASTEDSSNMLMQRFNQDQVEISGGKIRARTPHQIATISSHSANERLVVSKSDENETVVQNRLGGVVLAAIIRTDEGYFLVEELGDGESEILGESESKFTAYADSLRRVLNKVAPQSIEEHLGYSRYSYTYYDAESQGEDVRIYELLRNRAVMAILDEPNTYVAILEDCEIAKDQIEDVNYKLKSHVVRGRW